MPQGNVNGLFFNLFKVMEFPGKMNSKKNDFLPKWWNFAIPVMNPKVQFYFD